MRGLEIVESVAPTLATAGADAADIAITRGIGVGRDDYQECAEAWPHKPGNRVRVISIPRNPNEQLSL